MSLDRLSKLVEDGEKEESEASDKALMDAQVDERMKPKGKKKEK